MSKTITPVESTLRFATTVETTTDAWQFVMEYMDRVGTRPFIQIRPIWHYDDDGREHEAYEVVVSGMREES